MIRMKDLKRKQMISSVCATCATVFFLCFMMSTDQVSAADQIAKTSSQSITEMTEKKVQETIGSKSLKNELQSEGIITLGDGKQYYYKDGVVAHNYSGYITYSGLWYKIVQGRVDTDYTGMGTAETDNWCTSQMVWRILHIQALDRMKLVGGITILVRLSGIIQV